MNKLGALLTVMTMIFAIAACTGTKSVAVTEEIVEPVRDYYEIVGELQNFPPGTKIILQFIEGGIRPIPIDTAILDQNRQFVMKKKLQEDGIGRMMIGNAHSLITILHPQDYQIKLDKRTFPSSDVSGNPVATEFSEIWNQLNKQMLTPAESKAMVDSLLSPYSAFIVASNVKGVEKLEIMQAARDRLATETSDSLMVSNVDLMLEQTKAKVELEMKTAIGAEAPEIVSTSPDGREVKLSSLRGKIVLVDFWASWCGPCRRENPTVIGAWQKYKDKGFEVFGVSLDSNKDRWLQAIEKDGLIWENHVSELKKWDTDAAKDYGVSSIPANFLLDKDGNILAKNLRGPKLLQTLEAIFGQ